MKLNRGYTVLELVIYIGIVAVIAIASVQGIVSVVRTFAEIRSYADLRSGGSSALERMLRETRYANAIDLTGTVLGQNPGRLKLASTDESGAPKTVEFAVVGSSTIDIIENGVDKGSLLGGGVTLSNFVVRYATTTKSGIVKFELSLVDTRPARARTAIFYGSAVIRGAY